MSQINSERRVDPGCCNIGNGFDWTEVKNYRLM